MKKRLPHSFSLMFAYKGNPNRGHALPAFEPLSPQDFVDIESAGKIKLTGTLRAELQMLLKRYHRDFAFWSNEPRAGPRTLLDRIEKHSEALRVDLKELLGPRDSLRAEIDAEVARNLINAPPPFDRVKAIEIERMLDEDCLERQLGKVIYPCVIPGNRAASDSANRDFRDAWRIDLEEVLWRVTRLHTNAKTARFASAIQSTSGRPDNPYFQSFVCELSKLFKRAGGGALYSNSDEAPFEGFASRSLRCIPGIKIQGDLNSAIKRALKASRNDGAKIPSK